MRHREEFSDPDVVDCGYKKAGHPTAGNLCPGCKLPIEVGQHTGIRTLGPGPDPESRARARQGRVYNGVAIEAHWACLTGIET